VELICAIDLLDGGALRLVQGDYERRILAETDAPALATRFVQAGCRRIHVVDLAGARAGRPMQLPLVTEVADAARAAAPDTRIELGGGLRSESDVAAALAVVDDAILGTAAVEQPGFVAACARRFPGRIAVSLDLRGGHAALDGWLRQGEADPLAIAARLLEEGASRLIVTETSRDGTLAGPDLEALTALRAALPKAALVAAGGVGSLDDLRALDAIDIDGAVVGLALLTGAVEVAEAMAALS